MSNDIDLRKHFGNDYYAIGVFSCGFGDSKSVVARIYTICDACRGMKDEFNSFSAIMVINEIVTLFKQNNDLDDLILGYVPYGKNDVIAEDLSDYNFVSERMMVLVDEISKYPDKFVLIDLFNLINTYSIKLVSNFFNAR